MTVLNAEGYIYTYTNGGATRIVFGRALLADAFDASKYEFLKIDGTRFIGIPSSNDTSYGCPGGDVLSNGQGSILYSSYFNKDLLFTDACGLFMNFYTSDTPYKPWVGQASALS